MVDIVLKGLDERSHAKLKMLAARHGRSMAEELRQLVREAVSGGGPRAELKDLAAQVRALTAQRRQTPSEKLLRASRDSR